MEAMHTPSPWSAIRWTRHAATSIVVDDPAAVTGKRLIAECETEEDARLIAAVQELLEAVQAFMALDGRFSTDAQSLIEAMARMPGDDGEIARVVLKARIAIAKATGAMA